MKIYQVGDKVKVEKALTGNGERFPYWKPGIIISASNGVYLVMYTDENRGFRRISFDAADAFMRSAEEYR